MVNAPFSLQKDYWETFEIQNEDLDYLYNLLLEQETPLTSNELTAALVSERIRREKIALQQQQASSGAIYAPKDTYEVGQAVLFPAMDWARGQVSAVRPGRNPEVSDFDVISVTMEKGDKKQFAARLPEHILNQPVEISLDDELLDPQFVQEEYGDDLIDSLESTLTGNPDLVNIAGRWFPRALLVDVNQGHLNLAEASLDMESGGPLSTHALLEQVELPTDVNSKLTEFSFNFALQEDPRFDEVGPAGEVLWFLHRLEPDPVREPPLALRYQPVEYDRAALSSEMLSLERQLDDELSESQEEGVKSSDVAVSLIFPHWRSGTLPLTRRIRRMFPTAYESPRIQFTLVDADSGERIPAWVVRSNKYVYGLKDWYQGQGLIPGSLIHIKPGKNPGEVLIQAEKRRSNREWIRTVLVGADGGVVFAMLKQMVTAAFDERMAIAIPDADALTAVWEQPARGKNALERTVANIARELAKLNPQGHVHAQELYAAVNVVRRCPPGLVFAHLATSPLLVHVGDLYYRFDEDQEES